MNIRILSLLTFSLFTPILVHAQTTQKGLVCQFNSGKNALPGVGLDFMGAKSTVSDGIENFTLVFDNKKPGDAITLLEVKKAGFELVNETDVHSLRMSADGKLATELILAPNGII